MKDIEKPQLVIVTPALADANNGNWRTASRWAGFIAPKARTRLVSQWPDGEAAGNDRLMIALHARRSAPSIARWHEMRGAKGLAVVLTGTDLYRDIHDDPAAQGSLTLGAALVVLQERGPQALPSEVRAKARVIFQSARRRQSMAKPSDRLRVVMVGHLREEKSPETLFAAARQLAPRTDIRIDHFGEALDPALGQAARSTMQAAPNYRWHGSLSHDTVRRHIQRADLLVHTSRMEGGAHVIIEAVTSATPVVASRIEGNVGMLGTDYLGYFPWGDVAALVALLESCRASQGQGAMGLLARLRQQCELRARLFDPGVERRAVQALVRELLDGA